MAAVSLPLEIHGQIAQHVERKRDLVSYLASSRAVLGEVERELYRTINLTQYDPIALDELLDGLIGNPHRCSLVRQFLLRFEVRPNTIHIRKLEVTCRSLVNLVYLHLAVKDLSVSEVATRCTFQLQHFSYSGRSQDSGLVPFLISQPSLLRVDIPRILEIEALPSTSLPHLGTLTGTANAVNMILPGRSIGRLHWASQISPARFASVNDNSLDPPFLTLHVLRASGALRQLDLPETCPNLRLLEFPAPVLFFRPHELDCLVGLQHLHTIRVMDPNNKPAQPGGDPSHLMTVWNSKAFRQVVDDTFAKINSLQVFQFQHGARERRRGDSRLQPIKEWIPWYEWA